MATGTISKWLSDKGFGLIKQPGGADLFFHLRDCLGLQPQEGMAVMFDHAPGRDGKPAATSVRPAAGASTTPLPRAAAAMLASGQRSQGPGDRQAAGQDSPLLPNAAAALAAPHVLQPQSLNPSLFLDRLPTSAQISDQEHQKEHLDRVTQARPWTAAQYGGILAHLEGGGCDFTVTARSRIALHLSRAGGLENANCCLHPVYGFAYLPGSGLKGLAAAYAGHLWETQVRGTAKDEDFVREVEDIFGWAPNQIRNDSKRREADPRSARAGMRDHEQQRGAVVFHDAFGEQQDGTPPQLEVDVCTPHYGPYYRGESPPGDWLSPVPVTFLTIAAGTRFRFRVRPADSRTPAELVEAAKRLLLGGLYWLGAGAKTAAGYGAFEDHWEMSAEAKQKQKDAAEHAEQQRKIEAAHAVGNRLRDSVKSLKADQVLTVWAPSDPSQPGSRTGFLLVQDGNAWVRGPACFFKKEPLAKGRVWIVTRTAATNDKGQIVVQGPASDTGQVSPLV